MKEKIQKREIKSKEMIRVKGSSELFELLLKVFDFPEELELFLFDFEVVGLPHFGLFYLVLFVDNLFFPSETLN